MTTTIKDEFDKYIDIALGGSVKSKEDLTKEATMKPEDFFSAANTLPVSVDRVMFSHVFGFDPIGLEDFPITVFSKEDWPKHVQVDIPEFDPHYVWDKEALTSFAMAMEKGHKPRLVGNPGTGKSTMPMNYCAMVKRPFTRINFNYSIEPSDFIGQVTIKEVNGASVTEWVDGDLPTKMKEGYVLLLDEMYRAPSSILMSLQRVFERGGTLKINEKHEDNLVVPDENFRIVVADNTKGLGDNVDKFGSAMIQDVSSLNRFEITIEMDYLPPEEEENLLLSWQPEIQPKLAKQMVQLANLFRNAYNNGELSLPFSPRNMEAWAEYTMAYKNPVKALKNVYYSSLADETEQLAVKKFTTDTVFAKGLWGEL